MKSVTVAGIDCGTNSIRLKVSRVSEDGVEDIVPRILRVIRLGQDVDKTHRFADEALERAYAAAREFAEVLKDHPVDGIRFVATSATRDAENREEFEDNIERIQASLVPRAWFVATSKLRIWWLIWVAALRNWCLAATV